MADHPAEPPLSRARRKAITQALATLEESIRLTPSRRQYAVHRIQQARSPGAEAKRLIRGYLQGGVALVNRPDLSDVEELRVRLIRRDHWLDPQVRRLLAALGRAVAGKLARSEFQRRAAVIVRLKPTMPHAWRKAEAVIARDYGSPAHGAGWHDREGAACVVLMDVVEDAPAVNDDGRDRAMPRAPSPTWKLRRQRHEGVR